MSRIADQIGPTELNHKKTHLLLDYSLLIQAWLTLLRWAEMCDFRPSRLKS